MKRSAEPRASSGSASASAGRQRPHRIVGVQQRPALGDVEGVVLLETPGIEADRDVVGQVKSLQAK
jgi:hypothetical protein